MKLLLCSFFYSPEPVSRAHDLAVELTQRGHKVTVITGFPNYPFGRIYEGYKRRLWQWETIDGVRVLRVPSIFDHSTSSSKRIAAYLSYALIAWIWSLFLVERPDVIWQFNIGLTGVLIGWFKRVPLIHEVQDLWPDWARGATTGLNGWLYKILEMHQRFIYSRAFRITTISNGFKRVLVSKGVPADKIVIISNWANEINFRPEERDPQLGTREFLNNHFNIIYAGNIGPLQSLGVVLEAARVLQDLPDIQFVLYGDGAERQTLLFQSVDLPNVRFPGSRSQNEIAEYLSYADVLLVKLAKSAALEITIPSKTYSYLAIGRPILVAANGDVAELIEEIGAGLICPPDDALSLAIAVRKLHAMSVESREALGKAGREAFLTQFTRQILVDHFEKLFDTAARSYNHE